MRRQLTPLLLACLIQPAFATTPSRAEAAPGGAVRAVADFGKLPLAFEANQGQADAAVRFLSHGAGYAISFTETETVLSFTGKGMAASAPQTATVRMGLAGARPAPEVSGVDLLPGISNYFIGNDPARWHQNVPQYAKVRYGQVYPGVDLLYYGNQRQIEYDFVVAPKGDTRRIALSFAGVKKLSLDEAGNLVLATAAGDLVQRKPVAYQEIDGHRQPVDSRYVLRGKHRVGFQVARYDRSRPLVIDPVLSYATNFATGSGNAIAVDDSGYVYVTGRGYYPSDTAGAVHGCVDNLCSSGTFVAKLNPEGTALIYFTVLGSDTFSRNLEFLTAGNGIAVDSIGNAYVAGQIDCAAFTFPTTPGAFQSVSGCAGQTLPMMAPSLDAFVVKLNAAGNELVYSTYLGGSGNDAATGIAIDVDGNAYVAGNTDGHLPTTPGAYRTTSIAPSVGFVAKLNPSGSALIYSTYLEAASVSGLAIDPAGSAYVTGAASKGFPATTGAFQTSITQDSATYVAKLNPTGSSLVYATFLGTGNVDIGNAIVVDGDGHAYVTGRTEGTRGGEANHFPTTTRAFQTTSDGGPPWPSGYFCEPERPCGDVSTAAFVSKLSADGSSLIYSTYLGGKMADEGLAIAIDAGGNAYVAGRTKGDFPMSAGAVQPNFGGSDSSRWDAFVAKLSADGSSLLYSSYLGGPQSDEGRGIAVDRRGSFYITGSMIYTFPTVSVDYLTSVGGGAFVAKFGTSFGGSICPSGGLWVIDEEMNGQPGRGLVLEGDVLQDSLGLIALVFGYEDSGRATFYLAAGSMSGSTLEAPLRTWSGGKTFGGPLKSATEVADKGSLTIHIADATHGTVTLPGESPKAISKFDWSDRPNQGIVPMAGLWVVTAELNGQAGRGFTIEERGGILVLTVYAYEADGRPTFYQAVGALDKGNFSSTLVAYQGGKSLGGPWRSATVAGQAGPVMLSFVDATNGTVTFPGELPLAITRMESANPCL